MDQPKSGNSQAVQIDIGVNNLIASIGDHIGHFYETEDGWKDILVAFISTGLAANDKCVCITHKKDELLGALATTRVDIKNSLSTGQLVVDEGKTDPEGMQDLLNKSLKSMGPESSVLRWVGDMTWSLRKMATSENLMEWETHCNIVENVPAVFLCQYEISAFRGDVVLDAMKTHPLCIIGDVIHRNQFYIKPEIYLKEIRGRKSHSLA